MKKPLGCSSDNFIREAILENVCLIFDNVTLSLTLHLQFKTPFQEPFAGESIVLQQIPNAITNY